MKKQKKISPFGALLKITGGRIRPPVTNNEPLNKDEKRLLDNTKYYYCPPSDFASLNRIRLQ